MTTSASGAATGLSPETVHSLERASGELATKSVAAMTDRLPWFSRMPAEQRAGVLLITQSAAAGFSAWMQADNDQAGLPIAAFRDAPADLGRWINMRHTVVLIRIATEVFEEHVGSYAADDAERAILTEQAVRYAREVAFAAATAYAAAAESRGAWDARLEALVVDGIVRGDAEEELLSRAAALGWDMSDKATVIVGAAPSQEPATVARDVHARATRLDRAVLLCVQGSRLIVVLAGSTTGVLTELADAFGDGPVVAGPTVENLVGSHVSAAEALSGLRSVAGWASAPRPVRSADLLPERALAGDADAERRLIEDIAGPLERAGTAIESTVLAYLESGGVLEACARSLYVHPNTVRYRLKRVAEITGRNAMDPRDALVLRVGLIVGRLARARGLW